MLANYLKIALRTLWKNKLFSLVNILGLGLAIPFALLALLHLQAAFEFDNFHPYSDRIFRIITDEKTKDGGVVHYASSPYLLAEQLRTNYACVEKATPVVRDFGWELSNQLKTFKTNTLYVAPEFFSMFGFSLEKGSLPLEPNSLVMSQEAAEKFFGTTDPVGKALEHPTYGEMTITGVLKPYKRETQFRSDVMVSMATYEKHTANARDGQSWGNYQTHTFVRLQPNADPEALDQAIGDVASKTNANLISSKKSNVFHRQALADISPSEDELRYNPYVDSMQDIYFNFSIPLMILLLAGFNYTNLTLARSLSRSKEVGVRKVMGAVRRQLFLQFICEALVIAFFSLLLGIWILYSMKQFIHVQWVTWEVDNQLAIWLIFIIFTIILGCMAGMLPAWILSGFQPVKVLKGTLVPVSLGRINFRKVLTVVQFVVTIGFVFQIGHMYHQFNYMATENENFNRRDIFNISLIDNNYHLLRDEISQNREVNKIGLTSMPFGGVAAEYAIKARKNDENIAAFYYAVDAGFIDNMQLEFLAGSNLPTATTDSAGHFVVINEKAVEHLRLGTPREAIGKSIFLNNEPDLQVVGVVRNFCHYNYQYDIEPLVFRYNPAQFRLLSVRTVPNVPQEAFVSQMQSIWKKHVPYQPMVYSWYEQELYDRYYPAEDMKMMGMASVVIWVIAVLGLLGMVTYSTEKRYKEIGIRKVMGASVREVVVTLSWSFLKLLLIAGLIALPLGFLGGTFFMSLFTFHTDLSYGLMSLSMGIVLAVAVVSVGYYTTKAALMNPVESLRSE